VATTPRTARLASKTDMKWCFKTVTLWHFKTGTE